MKHIPFYYIYASFILLISCELFGAGDPVYAYHKCFFLAEDSFDIEGEIFINDELTLKADFEKISVKTDKKDWEIEGTKTSGNQYKLILNATANGISLLPVKNAAYKNKESNLDYHINISDFPYILTFFVDGRTTRGAISPELGSYHFVYIPEAIDLSRNIIEECVDAWGYDYTSYTYYDYNFSCPGWYKIYSANKPFKNNAVYSSGKNTKIRAPE